MTTVTVKTIKGTEIIINQDGQRLNVSVPSANIDCLPVKRCDAGLIATIGCGKHGVITFALAGDDLLAAHNAAKACESARDAYFSDIADHSAGRAKINNANYGSK